MTLVPGVDLKRFNRRPSLAMTDHEHPPMADTVAYRRYLAPWPPRNLREARYLYRLVSCYQADLQAWETLHADYPLPTSLKRAIVTLRAALRDHLHNGRPNPELYKAFEAHVRIDVLPE